MRAVLRRAVEVLIRRGVGLDDFARGENELEARHAVENNDTPPGNL